MKKGKRELSAEQAPEWILVGTLPNAGSTALAGLMTSAPGARRATPKAEALRLCLEWDRGARWDLTRRWDYARLARRFRRAAGPAPGVIVDKSPPCLPRLSRISQALGPDRTRVVVLTRHPLAVCASWVRRMTPEAVAREWTGGPIMAPGPTFLRNLGDLCGRWSAHLADAADRAPIVLRYEALCADPDRAAATLAAAVPALAGLDPGAAVAVKDHVPRPLVDMNADQIAALTPAERTGLREGLAPHAATFARLGYDLDRP